MRAVAPLDVTRVTEGEEMKTATIVTASGALLGGLAALLT